MSLKDLINIHTNGQLELYTSKVIKRESYNIMLSDLIDDQYWNFAYLTNKNIDIKDTWEQIKNDMNANNRKPALYVMSTKNEIDFENELQEINLKCLYTDTWMINENLENFVKYNSKLDMKVVKVNKDLKTKFIQAVMEGFSGDNPDAPYESLSEGYKRALENCKENGEGDYKLINYLGTYNNKAISTATVIYNKDKAIIYNVTTNKNFQKQGVCKQLMSEIVKDLVELGITTACVQTEQGFYTEQVYKNMGFKEVMLGKAYIEKAEE